MKELPPNKNFIQKNKNQVHGGTSSKLDRLKKLQQQTSKMINENQQLHDKDDRNNDAENYLLESID